ncbi:MAG: acetyl-CoA carboxylase biotin carboxyl carrier protein [Candidatus Anammoxibacter sp.]
MKMDIVDKVKQLVSLMNENDLSEIEIQEKAIKIRVKKAGSEIITTASPCNTESLGGDDVRLLGTKDVDSSDSCVEITAPMVGTFYRASSPGGEPFVNVGDNIDQDTVVCVVEAMKIMNEVKAGLAGEIVEILIKDADPVEYGQAMYKVKPVP